MSRTASRKLPQIAVQEQAVRTRVDLPAALNAELELYAHYFAGQTGHKPLTMGHVIVGLLQIYLAESAAFQKWKQTARGGVQAATAPFAQSTRARERANSP